MIAFINGCCDNKTSKNKERKQINPDDLIVGSDVDNNLDAEMDKSTKKASRIKTKIVVDKDEVILGKDDEENGNTQKKVDYDKLRKKANIAEAASIVGYDGKKIKKDLNKIIEDREKMDKEFKNFEF